MTLFREALSDHLTEAPADRAARATFPGMAHFAGTGPSGRTCRECVFWNHQPHAYRSKNGKHSGLIKPAACRKFQQLMHVDGNQIPDDARSCKYFDENPTPPARFTK